MASSVERLNAGVEPVTGAPMTPPLATVSKAHAFQTIMPAKSIAESVSIVSQSRAGSRRACGRFRKEPMALGMRITKYYSARGRMEPADGVAGDDVAMGTEEVPGATYGVFAAAESGTELTSRLSAACQLFLPSCPSDSEETESAYGRYSIAPTVFITELNDPLMVIANMNVGCAEVPPEETERTLTAAPCARPCD